MAFIQALAVAAALVDIAGAAHAASPITTRTFDIRRIASDQGAQLIEAKNITLDNVTVRTAKSPTLLVERVSNLQLNQVHGLSQ